ncbi:hypothetical protein BC832DRAFT_543186 [Gaertneriomyces semiglobifer]|nr:hypothetical protein BC832DRAFT_543186 [Gaertneriomyces semiglobifer]
MNNDNAKKTDATIATEDDDTEELCSSHCTEVRANTLQAFLKHLFPVANKVLDTVGKLSVQPVAVPVDATPGSELWDSLDVSLRNGLFDMAEDLCNNALPPEVREWLRAFFEVDRTLSAWITEVRLLAPSHKDGTALKSTKKLVAMTLPEFLKAFALGGNNPLMRSDTWRDSKWTEQGQLQKRVN